MSQPPPKNTQLNDARETKVWLRREQVLYGLNISMMTLRNYETRSRHKLPRHKSNTPEGIVYYDLREICEFYYQQKVRKEYGDEGIPEGNTSKKVNTNDEKARLTKAQADAQEIKNDVTRGDLAPIQLLEDALSDICGQISSILGAIPSKLRKKYSWLKAMQLNEIEAEVAKAQNAAAAARIKLPDRSLDEDSSAEDKQETTETTIGT